jgi:hypothetical protein
LALCAVTAVWIDFGTIHRGHHGDSIVPILTSLYHWTPYYWATNRNGNLIPLLAIPFKHPLVNLLVQDALVIFAGLATFFLLPRYVLRDARWPWAAVFSTTTFLLLAPEPYRFSYLVDQPYAVSLALGLGGLVLIEQPGPGKFRIPRSVLALLLIGLAHWVNVGIGSLLSPLVVLRVLSAGLANREARFMGLDDEAVHALMLLALGFGFGLLGMQLAHYHETAEGMVQPARWVHGWSRLASNTWTALAPHPWPIFLMLTAMVGLLLPLCAHLARKYAAGSLRAAAILVLTAILYAAFVGTLEWVERGGFGERYAIPSVILIHTGLSVLAASPLSTVLEAKPPSWSYAVAPLVLVAAGASYGDPSLSGVQDDLRQWLGSRTEDVLAVRCTHVAGNYWIVWPTVFHANLVRYQRGESGVIWGVSFRSDPTRERIKQAPVEQLRIAIPHQDNEVPDLLRDYGFPLLKEEERRRTITILSPKPATVIISR